MKVKQLSIFLENQSGRLAEVTGALGEQGISIRALSLADTSGFGILRLIVNDIEKAHEVIHDKGFTVRETDVIAVEMSDAPGGLAGILSILSEAGINVEYMYAFVQKSQDNAVVIFRIESVDEAIAALLAKGVKILTAEEVYTI